MQAGQEIIIDGRSYTLVPSELINPDVDLTSGFHLTQQHLTKEKNDGNAR